MLTLLAGLDAVANTAKTVLGIGGLIFVHELGHFLVGRLCNVKAEAFSIGFGPVLWKWQPGETEYRLSAIPLGGYVKFLGENPDERGERDPRSFHAATYPRKVAIMLAGVTMNVFVAFALFFAAFSVGVEVTSPVLGAVEPGSPAARAGLAPGDRIVTIDGHRIDGFEDIVQETVTRDAVTVVRERDGRRMDPVRIPTVDNGDGLRVIGISPALRGDGTLAILPDSPAAKAGLLSGDRVVDVAGVPATDATAAVATHVAARRDTEWTVVRGDAHVRVQVPQALGWKLGIRAHLDASTSAPGTGVAVAPDADPANPSPARDAGIAAGSRIFEVEGKPVATFDEIRAHIGDAGRAGRPLRLSWRAPDGTVHADREIRAVERPDASPAALGVGSPAATVTLRETNVVAAFALGLERTHRWVMRILGTLESLVTGRVSAKKLQGPIAIARATYDTADEGFAKLALFLGMISMNLAVLNVMPIPVLDGGQLALATIERVRGRPLPDRVVEVVQWTGLIAMLALMVLVVTNDLRNL